MMSRPLTALPTRPQRSLKVREEKIIFTDKTLLMGVINLTADSFSHDGRLNKNSSPASNIRFAKKLIQDGADIIDLGAESSRPGAAPLSVKEEISRLIPTLSRLSREIKVPISVDTYKPEVVERALDAGAGIINNIKGTQLNKDLLRLVKDYQASIVLMHMRGNPRTMQKKTTYRHLIKEIREELKVSIEKCLEMGIKKDRIIIDPGIGFSKTAEQNLIIIKNLNQFQVLGCPILIGPSRKSFIGHITEKEVEDRLMGTAAAVSLGVAAGANIVRVHDVAEMKEVVLVCDAIINQKRER